MILKKELLENQLEFANFSPHIFPPTKVFYSKHLQYVHLCVMHKDINNSLARPTSWIARTPFRNVATSQIFER